MAETISLEVRKKVLKKLLLNLYKEITPKYIRNLLAQYGMPTDKETVRNVTTSYKSFPTQDLALKAFELENGMKFWGIASGSGSRYERAAVKYLILSHFQEELNKRGIPSEMNIADLNQDTIEYMKARGMFKGKLSELRKIAKKYGNLENIMIGVQGALSTPI